MNAPLFIGVILYSAAMFVLGYHSALKWVIHELDRMGIDLAALDGGEGGVE